jgi:hypothetical protein
MMDRRLGILFFNLRLRFGSLKFSPLTFAFMLFGRFTTEVDVIDCEELTNIWI